MIDHVRRIQHLDFPMMDDERRNRLFPFLFNPLRKPTSAPSGHLLPEEGGRARRIGLPFLAHRLLFIFSITKKASTVIGTGFQAGDPREIRTPDTLIRSQVLYPAELLGHVAGAEGLKPPTYGFGDRCSINCAMPLSVLMEVIIHVTCI